MNRYPILFVGAGPGDPELITVKGQKALKEADLLVYAGSLVPEAVLQWTAPEAERLSSAPLNLDEIVEAMAEAQNRGKRVVRLHSGDPSLYGAIAEQMEILADRSIPYQVIPGVTAALAAAAALNLEYTVPEKTQTLILTRMEGRTPVPESESLESLASHGASLAIYLSAALVEKVAQVLEKTLGPEAPIAIAHRVSHPDQRIIRTTARGLPMAMKKAEISRQALILAGPALEEGQRAASLLYDAGFTHGFREGRDS